MNFFKLIRQSQTAFVKESELELGYLFGKKLKEIEYMKLKKPKYSGVFFRSLVFFYTVLRNFSFSSENTSNKAIYVFAGTDNQFNSLKPTLEALQVKGDGFYLSVEQGVSENYREFNGAQPVKFSLKVALAGFALFLRRAWPLYRKLKREKREVEISWHFSVFCQAYIFVPYFLDVLQQIQPGLVVMSNDHNVNNRSLRLAAEMLGIKTLYMQHASVSEIFPPLEFDYALLDGKLAHQVYLHCYEVQEGTNPRIDKNVANCQVVLTGQKKPVVQVKQDTQLDGVQIGLAVNQIDDFHCVQAMLDHLAPMQLKCIVRTHPFQNPVFLEQLQSYMQDKAWLSWSNSREQPLADYFANVNTLIAGNTSIHLEAALAGLPTFYYEMSDEVHRPDYYGYVTNGVSQKLDRGFTFETIKLAIELAHSAERHQAIKNYSETYGTPWQNREGELGARLIEAILKNQPFDKMLKNEEPGVYKSVMRLANETTEVIRFDVVQLQSNC